jgi:inositol hexakisphosphate/diphosphoinositol-pentakisphosphate kinase
VKVLCKAEEKRLTEQLAAEGVLDEDLLPYDQARALGKPNMDVDRIAEGLPCGSEGFLLMYARWKKLERATYNERKRYVSTILVCIGDSVRNICRNFERCEVTLYFCLF